MRTEPYERALGPITLVDPPPRLEDGTIIEDRYRIVRLLDEGAMGLVYEGEHLRLGLRVAIKVLPPHGYADPERRARFEREARALGAVSHPHVVGVKDCGFYKDLPYIAMEFLEGRTLRNLLDSGEVSPARAFALMKQILSGLAHAHDLGLVHRDLKPANVWVATYEGRDHAKLLDFGFAKFVRDRVERTLTGEGIVMGTPSYMSPEQVSTSGVDHRADIYSAGVLLFEMLAGRCPFVGDALDVIRAHLERPPPKLSEVRAEVSSKELDALLLCALEKDPERRFASAGAFSEALATGGWY